MSKPLDSRYIEYTSRVGVQPNVVVKPTVANLQAGRDTVLEAALTHLGAKQTAGPAKQKKSRTR